MDAHFQDSISDIRIRCSPLVLPVPRRIRKLPSYPVTRPPSGCCLPRIVTATSEPTAGIPAGEPHEGSKRPSRTQAPTTVGLFIVLQSSTGLHWPVNGTTRTREEQLQKYRRVNGLTTCQGSPHRRVTEETTCQCSSLLAPPLPLSPSLLFPFSVPLSSPPVRVWPTLSGSFHTSTVLGSCRAESQCRLRS